MASSKHGIVKNQNAEEQPGDKQRARTAHASDPDRSVSHEATRDRNAADSSKASGERNNG